VTSKYVYENVGVVGVSMVPTLQNHHHYLLNRWTYLFREPHPADIVVLRDPEDNGYAVKRIIGTAGDCIYIKNGRVYLNGRLLDEPYLEPGTATYASLTKQGNQWLICGTNQFFVMGDNRNFSIDSRVYGAIPRENILGTVVR
jgi:signal peptidase I